MNVETTSGERARAWVSGWITAMLSIAASVAMAFGVWLAVGVGDTEPLESPLMLSVARQLEHGPWGLYGPFGGQNPLVLIHAPLYYHLAALLARPLKYGGLDPFTAARVAGRSLSLFGLFLTVWSAFRIARLDGAPARAGWWAACLIASAGVMGATPYTVRPDMLGVGLQTTGVLLVLRAYCSKRAGGRGIVGGFAALGAAICLKQHLVGGCFAATVLLFWAWCRGRVSLRLVGLGVLTAGAIVATVYGVEELATDGRMSQAIFVAAPATVRVHPADWLRFVIVLATIAGASLCLIALLALAGLAQVGSKRGRGRAAATVLGTSLVGFALFMPIVHSFRPSMAEGLTSSFAILGCLFLVIPICAFFERRAFFGSWLDAALCLFAAPEIVIVIALCGASTGAWVNYAIQGIVFAAILTARSLSRACDEGRAGAPLISIAVAAFVLLSFEIRDLHSTFRHRRFERLSVELLLRNLKVPTSDIYFAGGPGMTREYGRSDLVFDDWLYPVFESVHLAELRSSWLRSALTDKSVRFVITASAEPRIDGLDEPLTSLGFTPRFEINSLYVWEQLRAPRR
jgi:hypothetical protein